MKVKMFELVILVAENSLGGEKQCYKHSVTIRAQ
jgi:hypothetical protein